MEKKFTYHLGVSVHRIDQVERAGLVWIGLVEDTSA